MTSSITEKARLALEGRMRRVGEGGCGDLSRDHSDDLGELHPVGGLRSVVRMIDFGSKV